MKPSQFYKIYSIVVSCSAVLVLVFGLSLGLFFNINFCLQDDIIPIAVLEIVLGLSTLPYHWRTFIRACKEDLKGGDYDESR